MRIYYKGLEYTHEKFKSKRIIGPNSIPVGTISGNYSTIDNLLRGINGKNNVKEFSQVIKFSPSSIRYIASATNDQGFKMAFVLIGYSDGIELGVADYASLIFDEIGGGTQ